MCLEGQISSESVNASLSRGRKAAGDLIPWNIAEQFSDSDFPKLAGARVVRIATHPNYQRVCRDLLICILDKLRLNGDDLCYFSRWDMVDEH